MDDCQTSIPDDDDGRKKDEQDAMETMGEVASAASKADGSGPTPSCAAQSFHVTKFVMLRLVGLVYLVAFLGAYHQNIGLMGVDGLVPARHYVDDLRTTESSPIRGFLSHPSLYWLATPPLEDWQMVVTAVGGLVLSFAVVLGLESSFVMVALWMLYFTIVTSAGGNSFYAYGWESQLLETGFLSIWLCDLPFLSSSSWCSSSQLPPSLPVLWLFRWLCARISVGAGLIKHRGGECWRNKTCLYYHFETQPIPRYAALLRRYRIMCCRPSHPSFSRTLISILENKTTRQSAFVFLSFPPEVDSEKCCKS